MGPASDPPPDAPAADDSARRWLEPSVLIATCGGLGRIGIAPGTWGAAAGILLSLAAGWTSRRLAVAIGDEAATTSVAVFAIEAAILAAVNLAGIPLCSRAARRLGLGGDPGAIVYDEAASLPLGLLAVPPAARSPAVLAAGFVLHRIFDIWKPFPCRRLEHLPAGLGIMADDWGAAAWMAICLALVRAAGLP